MHRISEEVDELSKNYNLDIRIGHNITNGFHIILPLGKNQKVPTLPSVFQQVIYDIF